MIRASVRQWLLAGGVFVLLGGCDEGYGCSSSVAPPPPPPLPPPPPAPVAQSITKLSGDGTTRSSGGDIRVSVLVTGSNNAPFQGATVNWLPGPGGSSVSPASSVSVADGSAETTWTLPAGAAAHSLMATLAANGSMQSFTATIAECFNGQTISDDFSSDLGAAGWSVAVTQTPPPPPTLSAPYSYQTTGGSGGGSAPNPGGYRRMENVMSGAGSISVYFLRELAYDPNASDNVIDHINYSEDQLEFNPPFQNAAVGWGFFFEQNGNRYVKTVGSAAFANISQWLPASISNMTAADFGRQNFLGGPIKFGFFRSNTNISTNPHTVTHGIDNWRVEICKK